MAKTKSSKRKKPKKSAKKIGSITMITATAGLSAFIYIVVSQSSTEEARAISSVDLVTEIWEAPQKTAFLLSNGASVEAHSIGGVLQTLQCDQEDLLPNADFLIFGPNGKRITSCASFKENETLYAVPEGDHFIWPAPSIGHIFDMSGVVASPEQSKPLELEVISDSPRVLMIKNFMSSAEVDALIASALNPKNPYGMQPSTVGPESWTQQAKQTPGKRTNHRTRTSENAFVISTHEAMSVKRRAFEMLRLPKYQKTMADGIQVLRYELGQAYIPHTDYFAVGTKTKDGQHNYDPENGGTNRFATVFLYLSDVEEGGQTVFPLASTEGVSAAAGGEWHQKAAALFSEGSWERDMTNQCFTRLATNASKGNAVLFYSQLPGGALDPQSLHGGCPVLAGTKWAANLWVWNGCRYGVQC